MRTLSVEGTNAPSERIRRVEGRAAAGGRALGGRCSAAAGRDRLGTVAAAAGTAGVSAVAVGGRSAGALAGSICPRPTRTGARPALRRLAGAAGASTSAPAPRPARPYLSAAGSTTPGVRRRRAQRRAGLPPGRGGRPRGRLGRRRRGPRPARGCGRRRAAGAVRTSAARWRAPSAVGRAVAGAVRNVGRAVGRGPQRRRRGAEPSTARLDGDRRPKAGSRPIRAAAARGDAATSRVVADPVSAAGPVPAPWRPWRPCGPKRRRPRRTGVLPAGSGHARGRCAWRTPGRRSLRWCSMHS